jgi:rhodanese-related sulfurtransferase
VHIPIHELPARLAEVPAGEVWVHCAAGARAAIAAGMLDRAGRTVVSVDDEFDNAAKAGLEVAA